MQTVNAFDYAETIVKALSRGILLTTKAGEKVNSMVIGWGTLGIEWGKPIFAAYVREGRFTREQLDANPYFTINVPLEKADPEIIRICGSKCGRDVDKVKESGMTLVEHEDFSVPGVEEFPLTLECKVVFRQKQEIGLIDERFHGAYPQDVPGTNPMDNRDAHIAYYGEIVGAYLAK